MKYPKEYLEINISIQESTEFLAKIIQNNIIRWLCLVLLLTVLGIMGAMFDVPILLAYSISIVVCAAYNICDSFDPKNGWRMEDMQ
jgi:Na+/H+ antiporter NhaC